VVAARIFGGMAFYSPMIASMYIAEMSRPQARGKMVSVNPLNIVLGFSAAYFANYFFFQASGSANEIVKLLHIDVYTWHWMLAIEAIPALIYALLLFTIAESPRWLVLKNCDTEAAEVLAKLIPRREISEKMAVTKQSVGGSQLPLLSRLKMLVSPALKLALVIGLVVGITRQLTGVNAIYFYARTNF
jgi:MFS family permease